MLNGAAAFVTQLTQPRQINTTLLPPPHLNFGGDGPSPTSILDNVFDDDSDGDESWAPPTSSHDRSGLIGFVPNSKFLRFARDAWFKSDTTYMHVID